MSRARVPVPNDKAPLIDPKTAAIIGTIVAALAGNGYQFYTRPPEPVAAAPCVPLAEYNSVVTAVIGEKAAAQTALIECQKKPCKKKSVSSAR